MYLLGGNVYVEIDIHVNLQIMSERWGAKDARICLNNRCTFGTEFEGITIYQH